MFSILFVPVSLSEEVLFIESFRFTDVVDDVLPFEIGNFIQTKYAFSKSLESGCHISYASTEVVLRGFLFPRTVSAVWGGEVLGFMLEVS